MKQASDLNELIDHLNSRMESLPKTFPSTTGDRVIRSADWGAELIIEMELCFSSPLDVTLLQQAYLLTLYAEPILSCRYTKNWWRDYFVRMPLNLEAGFKIAQSVNEYDAFKNSSMDHSVGPMLQCCLLNSDSEEENTYLNVKISHLAADAKGLHQTVALMSKNYQLLLVNPNHLPVCNIQGRRGMTQVFSSVPQKIRWQAPLRVAKQFKGVPMNIPHAHPPFTVPVQRKTPDSHFRYNTCELTPEQTDNLINYCKRKKVTLNDVFQAAYARAMMIVGKKHDQRCVCTWMTVDLRRFIRSDHPMAISNLSGGAMLPVSIDPTRDGNLDFETTLKNVAAITQRLKNDWIGIDQTFLFAILMRIIPSGLLERLTCFLSQQTQKKQQYYNCLTNLGEIKEQDVNFGQSPLSAVLLVPPFHPPQVGAGVSSYNNRVTFSVANFNNEGQLAVRVIEQIRIELLNEINFYESNSVENFSERIRA